MPSVGPTTAAGVISGLDGTPDEALTDLIEQAEPDVQRAPTEAVARLSTVAAECDRRGLDLLAGRSRYLLARALVYLGRLGDALVEIDRAREHFIAGGRPVDALRTALGQMHVLDDLGRQLDALAVGERVLSDLGGVGGTDDTDAVALYIHAAVLENMGVSCGYLGRAEPAMGFFARAEAAYRELSDREGEIRCRANVGVELTELGRGAEAVVLLNQAREAFLNSDDRVSAARCCAYAARACLQCGELGTALRHTDEAAELLIGQELTTEYARIELVRADAIASLNMVDDAIALYTELEGRFDEAGLARDAAHARIGRGQLLLSSGQVTAARPTLVEAAALVDPATEPSLAAIALIGVSYTDDSDDRARLHAEAALAAVTGRQRPAEELSALIRLLELSGPDERAELLERASALLADDTLPHLAWRLHLEQARIARRSADDVAALGWLEMADGIIERLRGSVADERWRAPFMRSRRSVHADTVSLLLDRGEIDSAFERTQRARARTLVEHVNGQGPILSPRTPDPAVAELTYEVIDDEILAFLRCRGEVTVHRNLSSVGRIMALLGRLEAQWRRFENRALAARMEELSLAATLDLLQQLHVELLGRLAGALDDQAIVVSPVGPLVNVPFAALHDGRRHLIEKHTIGVVPSTLAPVRPATPLGPDATRLILSVPDASAPLIDDETDAILALGATTARRGDDATADALRRLGPEHDVVHIACHGITRRGAPQLSALRLADGWLTADEVAGFRLSGQLVVLSACSTGHQQMVGGADEVAGLPRAFLAAGASGVIVNHWRVDDEASAALMSDLHRRMLTADPLNALRGAQLDLLAFRPHPYLWAPAFGYGIASQVRLSAAPTPLDSPSVHTERQPR